jgi:hypothetical protein
LNYSEEQRQRAIYLTQAAVVLLGPSGRLVEGRGLVLYRLTVEHNGVQAVQIWTITPHNCVLCVTDCGEVEIYHPEIGWETTVITWSQEQVRLNGLAATRPEEPPPFLQFEVQVTEELLGRAKDDEQHAQLQTRMLSALEEAGAAMLRSYERWLLRDRLPSKHLLPREERSTAWTGNPEQPGHVVTRNAPRQTIQDVVQESTALFLRGFNHGEYD